MKAHGEQPMPVVSPIIDGGPVSQSALAGQSVWLSVTARGLWPLSYQWFRNAQAVAGATNAYLNLENVTPGQAGTYWVEVRDQAGNRALSRLARLQVSLLATQTWVATYQAPISYPDIANAIATDDAGNIYATGLSYQPNAGVEFTTIKLNAVGERVWLRNHTSLGFSAWGSGNAIAVGKSGNIFVAGQSNHSDNGEDYLTIKYDPDGNEFWAARYNTGEFSKAEAYGLALDSSENLYVSGNLGTVKYDRSGTQIWAETNSTGQVMGTKVDAQGSLYVLRLGYRLTKYDPSGQLLWKSTAAESNAWSSGFGIDAAGMLYVTGLSGTRKYDAAGQTVWTNADAIGWGIVMDSLGRPIIAGQDSIYKIDANGNRLWRNLIGGAVLITDATDNVYFASASSVTSTKFVRTIGKLDPSGNLMWAGLFGSPTNEFDQPGGLAVDNSGRVYAGGRIANQFCVTVYTPITIPGAPSITAIPAGQLATPGSTLSMMISAEGAAPLAYQWLLGGSEIEGATNQSLIITNFQTQHAGEYSVFVSNPATLAWTVSAVAAVGLENNPLRFGPSELVTKAESPQSPFVYSFMTLTLLGEAGRQYVIESSTNLIDWTRLAVLGNDIGVLKFQDPAPLFESRFYRARSQ